MGAKKRLTCGICEGRLAGSRIRFSYDVPETREESKRGSKLLRLDMPLCRQCAPKVFKHLTRFFGRKPFQEIDRGPMVTA